MGQFTYSKIISAGLNYIKKKDNSITYPSSNENINKNITIIEP